MGKEKGNLLLILLFVKGLIVKFLIIVLFVFWILYLIF